MLWRFLIWQLLYKWWVTAADHSANDELQPQISTGGHCSLADRSSRLEILSWLQKLWKNCGNHPASIITLEFFIWGVTCLLKNESHKYYTDREEWSTVVTHHLQSNCQMRNCHSKLFGIKYENFVKKSLKYVPVRAKTDNLSTGIIFVYSQTRVTIPLILGEANMNLKFIQDT